MKKYKIIVIDKKTKAVIHDFEEISNTKKYLISKYKSKHRFDNPPTVVKVEWLRKAPGVQVDLLEMIEEVEDEQG